MMRTQIVRRAAGAAPKQRPPAANFRRAPRGPPFLSLKLDDRRAAVLTRKRPAFTSEVGAFAWDGKPPPVTKLKARYGEGMAPPIPRFGALRR